jgi:hypothetical protein
MTDSPVDIQFQTVPDLFVAGIRFRGDYADIRQRMTQLFEAVQPHITGPLMCLYHALDPASGHDLEVCIPVAQAVPGGRRALLHAARRRDDHLHACGAV